MFRKDHDEKTKRLANFLNDFYRVKYILLGGTVQRGFLLLSIARLCLNGILHRARHCGEFGTLSQEKRVSLHSNGR